jgi:hypothetical protein
VSDKGVSSYFLAMLFSLASLFSDFFFFAHPADRGCSQPEFFVSFYLFIRRGMTDGLHCLNLTWSGFVCGLPGEAV